ncbi:Retrieval of early ER protein Rer1 [Dillenia turbinata]|uniref:Retrieval of early ER protein Rer1 n=1 Tax=Dillenia turbinata TaxID=194707 RepID=A0AAN8Z3T5_9MAGN
MISFFLCRDSSHDSSSLFLHDDLFLPPPRQLQHICYAHLSLFLPLPPFFLTSHEGTALLCNPSSTSLFDAPQHRSAKIEDASPIETSIFRAGSRVRGRGTRGFGGSNACPKPDSAGQRWLGALAVATIYVLRVYYLQGFDIVLNGFGIYILNLLIGFLSPKVDPELEVLDGASLPTKKSDEFKPFIHRLPEFKFWYAITRAMP